MPATKTIEPNPVVIEGTLDFIQAQLIKLMAEMAKPEPDWYLVRNELNRVHLDAKDTRDYLYRCEGL